MTSGGAPAWEFAATGTRWRLYHSGALPEHTANQLADAVRADEARWSRFRDDSEVAALNRRPGQWVPISAETFAVLDLCRTWTERTAGVFQPLIGRALADAGYARSITEQAPFAAVTVTAEAIRAAIGLDRAACTARIPPGTALDLGGIGKGWIAARVASRLLDCSRDQALLVDAGGDLLAVTGEHLVAVEDPEHGGVQSWITLAAGQAVATSGCGRRQWTNGDGRRSHHLIDPRTGAPGPFVHATLVADDAVSADIGAKVLALRPDSIARCVQPARVQTSSGTRVNDGWRARLTVPSSPENTSEPGRSAPNRL
jgi:thiamine biosynthesis lipoprotein